MWELKNDNYYWVPRRLKENADAADYRASMELEILRCLNKMVLVLESREIDTEFDYLSKNYPSVTFFKGNRPLFETLNT